MGNFKKLLTKKSIKPPSQKNIIKKTFINGELYFTYYSEDGEFISAHD